MNAFLYALQFLTRLPVSITYKIDRDVERNSFYWHGCIGIVLGACLILTHHLSHWLFGSVAILNAAIVLMVWVLRQLAPQVRR